MLRFIRAAAAAEARQSWQEGFTQSCDAPCAVPPSEVDRFLAAVTPVRRGEIVSLLLTPGGVQMTVDGHAAGDVPDPALGQLILATFIGRTPPTAHLKRQLLGLE